MINRFKIWYNNLSTRKQIWIDFLFNWLIWFPASWGEDWFTEKQHSLTYHIFHSILMAFLMSALFNWGKFKSFFKKNWR